MVEDPLKAALETSLQQLDLSYCPALQNVDGLKESQALRTLNLSETPIRDAQLFTLLRGKGIELSLDDEQEALLPNASRAPIVVPEAAAGVPPPEP